MIEAKTIDYQDSYSEDLPATERPIAIEEVGRAFFSASPKWLNKLFTLRNHLVKLIGLKVDENAQDREAQLAACNFEVGDRLGLFKVFQKNEHELIIGEDDKHLDFRISFLIDRINKKLNITTTVYFNNWMGKLYFIPVKPFHSLAVPAMLRNMIHYLK